MKRCTCNATNPDDAKFCRICGCRFDDAGSGITEKQNPIRETYGTLASSNGSGITEKRNPVASKPPKIVRGIKFVYIAGGTFTMGSPESEPKSNAGIMEDETQHEVTLSAFYMAEKPVTCKQFSDFLNENEIDANGRFRGVEIVFPFSRRMISDYNMTYYNRRWLPKRGKDDCPVVHVSWHGAKAYCEWFDSRLPSEAEWEYACRAGTRTAFNTGENLTRAQAYYCDTPPYSGVIQGLGWGEYQPVGSYPPNAWGLYDMHGSVEEWCLDGIGPYSDLPKTNPVAPPDCSMVTRGGGFDSIERCRSAARRSYPGDSTFGVGFRMVLPT